MEKIVSETKKTILLQQRQERDFLASKNYLKRHTAINVADYLKSSLIKVVIGPRRAGKSVFGLQMLQGTKYAYLNFDDNQLLKVFDESQIMQVLEEVYPGYEYMMLDEIQNLEGWERWVETLYRRGVNLVITGSNAKMLSTELSTMLSGRYIEIAILPFSLSEDMEYVGVKKSEEMTPQERGVYMHEVDEYMHNGGYPEVIGSRALTETYLRGVYDTVLLKDIIQRYKIHKTDELYNIAEWLVSNYTGMFTTSSLKDELGMASKTTVSKYCGYLEHSYMFFYLPRFNNKLQLMKKAPQKIYLVDNGFVKAKSFGVSADLGKLLENMVFVELLRRGYVPGKTLFYYHTRNDKEIDFVLREGNKVECLVQVSYDISSPKTYKREQSALEEGSEELRCDKMCVVTWDTEGEMAVGEKKAKVVRIGDF
jgi:hypothetical protein